MASWAGRIATIVVSIQLATLPSDSRLFAASHFGAELFFFEGRYDQCERLARAEVERGVWNERWPELLIRCLLTRGKYEEAVDVYEQGLRRYASRITYRLLGDTVYRYGDQPKKAEDQLAAILQLVRQSSFRFGSSRDQVTLGRYFQREGEDGRQVLELIFDRVRQRNPKYAEVYIATAELALTKHDHALASQQLDVAAELQPSNPKVFYLQAAAWREQDAKKATDALRHALKINPRHVPSLLLQVDQLIDAEQYTRASKVLEQVLEVNHREPKAWAYHAVIAHLVGHFKGERALRDAALSSWSANHEVDHLIGLKLSQKYRFEEGAAHQRLALANRPNDIPSKFQLAQDLLRLGEEAEGWRLAGEVQEQDNYHVVAYNLATLKQSLERFRTLTSDHFVLRMETREAAIYGRQALELLESAYIELCPKYDVRIDEPIYVEVFSRQQDFAIRTFGLPGGAGYLGVCFGRLITANSPASQGASPTNWQSVLWHEFCHVVTLQKTRNRMPRWLSEGISVYEERQRDASWGQSMTAGYRQMILSGQLTPVSRLSGAFLRPPSPQHLQFAYYESSLVVEFLVEKVGIDVLRRVLVDLSVGMPINESLSRYTDGIGNLDDEFAAFAKQRAESLAPEFDWDSDRMPTGASAERVAELLEDYPNNYWLLVARSRAAITGNDWPTARSLLERVHRVFPHEASADGPTRMLASVYREMGQREQEHEVLATLARHDADAVDAFRRLMDLATEQEQWEQVREFALRITAVNPMISLAQERLSVAAERLNDARSLIDAQVALLQMDPADPALAYYRLAVAHRQMGDSAQAKRNVLMALEEAPRFRDAQTLLLKLIDNPTE